MQNHFFNSSKVHTFFTVKKQGKIFLDETKSIDKIIDEKDIVFYEVTLTAKDKFNDAYLVTGNGKHFPIKPFVVTPAEMIEIIEESGEDKK